MKRKIVFVLILIGLITGVGFVVKALGSRTPKQGELQVESAPVASIFLDNKNIGRSPYKDKVDAGEYTLKLVPESTTDQLSSWEGKVTVGSNLLTYVNADLSGSELSTAVDVVWLEKITSQQAELSVTTNPDGATILVDDQTKGVTPLSIQDISPGDHTVSVTSLGFLTRTLKIKATPGYRLIANLKLALSPGSQIPSSSPSATPSPQASAKSTPKTSKTASSSANTVADPPRPFVILQDTPTGFLRVRMEASTGASEAARVNPGEKYTIVDSKDGWYEIEYDGTNSGWVSAQYAEKVE